MPKFISDEEMAKLEAAAPAKKSFVSDSEMAALEKSGGAAAPTSAWDEASLLSKVKDFDWVTHEPLKPQDPSRTPIEPSIAQNLGYAGGVVSTGLIQGAKALTGNGSADEVKEAIAGRAKSAPQQLEESGLSPAASYAVGIPLQVATDPMAGFSGAPVAAGLSSAKTALSPVAQYIGNRLKDGAERFATSPVFGKVADATNVVGKGKSILDKVVNSGAVPESVRPIANAATEVVGRAGVYKTPLAPVQAVSDAARGVAYAQQGVAKILDKSEPAIQRLVSSKIFSDGQLEKISASPFFQALKSAGEKGGPDAVATAHYVLQQTEPEYQQLLKDEQN